MSLLPTTPACVRQGKRLRNHVLQTGACNTFTAPLRPCHRSCRTIYRRTIYNVASFRRGACDFLQSGFIRYPPYHFGSSAACPAGAVAQRLGVIDIEICAVATLLSTSLEAPAGSLQPSTAHSCAVTVFLMSGPYATQGRNGPDIKKPDTISSCPVDWLWRYRDSNSRPSACKADALPTELYPRF